MSVRNDPCPCGSSLKYKKCCLLKEKTQAVQRERFIKLYNTPCPCGSHKKYGVCCMHKAKTPVKRETALKAEV